MLKHFDLVIKNGRIIDPTNRFDGTLNLGVRTGKLAALTIDTISGKEEIDASGLAVSPGFIDIHIDLAIALDIGLAGDSPGVDKTEVNTRLADGPILVL